MIYFDRPFSVGDWISSPDRNIEGTVERIGMRMTMIRTFESRPLYVPNSVFSSIVVQNPSRMQHRRIRETIGIRYKDADKMAVIVDEVKTMLQNHPDIEQNATLMVNFDAFAGSSLEFFIYTFTKTVNWARYHEVKQDVMLKIIEIVQRNGADFASQPAPLLSTAMMPLRLLSRFSQNWQACRTKTNLDTTDVGGYNAARFYTCSKTSDGVTGRL